MADSPGWESLLRGNPEAMNRTRSVYAVGPSGMAVSPAGEVP